jgi:hypothetical protein
MDVVAAVVADGMVAYQPARRRPMANVEFAKAFNATSPTSEQPRR